MIVVTGGAGFIGSNIVAALNRHGRRDILVVDDLTDGHKFRNLAGLDIADYQDRYEFLVSLSSATPPACEAILHQGACSETTEWDGRYMMDVNYRYSKELFGFCQRRKVPFIYASSASVYGAGPEFVENPELEKPLNVYGYSKALFDQYVRRHLGDSKTQVVGLRYFNVYGPNEGHKQKMASVAFHFDRQIREDGEACLYVGCDGYGDGEQRRDFIYVGDVADCVLWFLGHRDRSGIFNLGTGRSQTFNDVANAVIAWHGRGRIRYIPFPGHLVGNYQSFTQADLVALRACGYDGGFLSVEEGVKRYLDQLHQRS
jgi:ADP-L-glycero-D-manno-heptose 6-epimerase